MGKKEEFKEFAKNHQELFEYVKDGKSSWQELYEVYDIYGEDSEVWNKYQDRKLASSLKNIDVDKISGHLDEAKKVIDLISAFTKKEEVEPLTTIPEVKEIDSFFKD